MSAYPLHVLVNDFAIRSFRDTADRDYVHARLAYRANLIPQFQWSSLHCLEKYAKCILLLNRINGHKIRHEISGAISRLATEGKFEIELSKSALEFVAGLEDGAQFRYFEVSYFNQEHDIVRLDQTVWELRRYCQPLDYELKINKIAENRLRANLEHIRGKLKEKSKDSCIINGWLESVISNRKHPAREPLLWNNLYLGPSRRKSVRMVGYWEAGNAPLYLHPEILDEVLKYVFIPAEIKAALREELRT